MGNSKDEITKLYWSQLIIVGALIAVAISFIGISAMSLMQTEQAFQPLNDPNIILFGFSLGNYISIMFALVAQYTQNVALYIKRHFCTNKIIYETELPFFGEIVIYDTRLADGAFIISAVVDSLTNVVWFYQTVQIPSDLILGTMLRIIGYTSMIASVFVEEALGTVLDALRKATRQLSEIKKSEKRIKERESFDTGSTKYNPESTSPVFRETQPYKGSYNNKR